MFRPSPARLAPAIGAVLAMVWALFAAAAAPVPVGSESLPDPTVATSVDVLPLGFHISAADQVRIVRAVATDIDQDGDLDVVANQGSVDLAVWINDGAGHFTRKDSGRPHDGWMPERAAPSVGDRQRASDPPDRNDTHALVAFDTHSTAAPVVARPAPASNAPFVPCPVAFTRTPRAPPAA